MTERYSCSKCHELDDSRMVQCDQCVSWYHFNCVGVTSSVADVSWSCEKCRNPLTTTSSLSTVAQPPPMYHTDQPLACSSPQQALAYSLAPTTTPFGSTGGQQPLEHAADQLDNNPALPTVIQTPTGACSFAPITMWSHGAPPAAQNARQYDNLIHTWSFDSMAVDRAAVATKMSQIPRPVTHHQITNSQNGSVFEVNAPYQPASVPHTMPSHYNGQWQPIHSGNERQPIRGNLQWPNNANNQLILGNNFAQRLSGPTPAQLAARHVLPKDLPSFNGDPEEWPMFYSSFQSSTEIAGYTNAENMVRLQACLKGRAREMVRSRLLLPDMVPDAIQTLRMCFGRPELIIETLIEKARKISPVKDRLDSLIDFALAVRNISATMEASGLDAHMNNPMLVKELIEKLSNQHKLSWAMHHKDSRVPVVKSFSDWLFSLAEAATQVVTPSAPHSKRGGVVGVHEDVSTPKIECAYCHKTGHRATQCEAFADLSLEDRWEAVRRKSLCRQCLNSHRRRCFNKRACGVNGCTYKHHRLLHGDNKSKDRNGNATTAPGAKQRSPAPQPQKPNRGVPSELTSFAHDYHEHDKPFFRIIPVRIYNKNKFLNTFAFLDEGSSVTLIDQELFNQLDLNGVHDPLCLRWTGNRSREEAQSVRANIKISSAKGGEIFKLINARTVENLALSAQTVNMAELATKYHHLQGLPIASYTNARPTILIGSDNWRIAVPLRIREGKGTEPIATKTRLGWAVQGGGNEPQGEGHVNFHSCDCERELQEIHELVKSQFKLEEVNKATLLSRDDERAMTILKDTCKKIGDRFEVGLLWRSNNVNLPDSYPMAHRRLICLKNKLQKDPNMKVAMQQQVENLIVKGYARKLSEEDLAKTHERAWYLPMFVALNPNKPGKVRVVWDAAAKSNGMSLNDFMVRGPDTLNSLFGILLSFRMGRIAVCGDIAEMYHQIRVRESDAHAQRFLWWENGDTSTTPIQFVMQSLSFGISCAPCIAHYVRDTNAELFRDQSPQAVAAIQQQHYMDDYIDSGDDEHEMIELAQNVKMIHAKAGFHIRNWASNSSRLLQALTDESDSANQTPKLGDCEKILGIYWDPRQDAFRYELKFARLKRNVLGSEIVPTKREVLQVAMSVFDPLGLIAWKTIQLRVLLQDVWRAKIEWDEELPTHLYNEWLQWKSTIPSITAINIPRCYSQNLYAADKIELHLFVDAGEQAYAAIAYLRVCYRNSADVSLVAAKAKVAPLKPLSIPRLELQAAVMGARLAAHITSTSKIKVNTKTFWTDSTTVLKWLRVNPRDLQQFVMYRVAEILDTTSISEWKWVPSKQNPADLSTKSRPKTDTAIWSTGPPFLTDDESTWPKRDDLGSAPITELRSEAVGVHVETKESFPFNITKFSEWKRLHRAVATAIQYIDQLKARTKSAANSTMTSSGRYKRANNLLIKQAQRSEFASEIHDLQHDDAGILRVRGRIQFLIQRDAILLPQDHYVTFLIVKDMHEKYHHQCHETVINELKGKYHVPRLRVLYKKVRKSCQHCKNANTTPLPPQMAQLPAARLAAYERPFTNVGIDYFGPMSVVVGRRREKRWGVIFTCLTVRAIHIEIAHSLTTESCLLCLRNFIARRGMPRQIFTDNGTNFRATARLLAAEGTVIDYNAISRKTEGINWNFNPPAAPHMGGVWERLIRSIKTILGTMLPSWKHTEESLRTALLEVELIVNSRPLTFVSIDHEDDEAITPNHLLLGSANGEKPMCTMNMNVKEIYRASQEFGNRFWQRWVREYSPILTRRTKWFEKQPPLKVGDIVIVVDETLKRGEWPKGVVVATKTAKDGQVRRAVVKTQGGMIERPAVKLAVMDVGAKK